MRINLIKWQTKHTHISGVNDGKSEFTGGALGYFGTSFVCALVTIVTLTLGMYWARCHKERWLAKHKIIDGLRLEFDGKAIQYFGKRVLWTFLTIITLFIYSFWLIIKSKKWITKHIVFVAGQKLPPITERGNTPDGNVTPINNNASAVQTTSTKKANGFAVAGFVMSFVAFPLLGIIFSSIGLAKSKKTGNGKGLSIAGLVISILYILYIIAFVVVILIINDLI